jgi:phage/plasmid-associated DNA primase
MNEPLNFAILSTKSTNQVKVLSLVNGVLVKESIANCFDGVFTQHQSNTLADFAGVLDTLTPKQSLILGTPHRQDDTALQVGEKINLTTKNNPTPKAIPRSKDFIKYRNHAGFMLFDIDGGGTYEQLLEFIPELNAVGALIRPSSSSFIYDENGNELNGAKGWHIFIPVLNVADSERIAPILWGRMWLAGYGHYLLSNGLIPQRLERGLFDKAVLGACERLAFEAKPILQNGLIQKTNEQTRIIDGSYLDTSIIQDLTAEQWQQVEHLKQQAKDAITPQHQQAIKAAKRAYIAQSGKPAKEALKDFKQFQQRELTPDFKLYTVKGEKFAGDLNASDDGLTMCDPFEPDYDGGSKTKAKFYWNKGNNPIINSQAHGGIKYSLAFLVVVESHHEPINNDDWEAELLNHVEKFNRYHAQVLIGKKHKIMRIIPSSFSPDERETLEFISQSELEKTYQNRRIKTGITAKGNDIYDNHIKAWAEHHKSLVYKGGVIFKPNAPKDEHYFNTWRGFAVEPKPAKNADVLERVFCHIEQVVCGGDYRLIEYFYNWIAYTLQKPDKPAGAALVLRGEKGTGKGTIGHFLKAIWGVHGVHISNAKHLIGNFNGHLADTCFLFADEAFYSADKQHEGVLKALITEPCVMIERKGIDAIQQPNYLKVFMATNNDWAVPASKDERRYCVFDVSSEMKDNKAYFDALHSDIETKDVQAAFLHEMLVRDIRGFHTGQIPETEALKEQRLHSLNSVGKWLVDCLSSGQFELNDNDATQWQPIMTARDLFNSYLYWCDNQRTGEYNRVTQTAFGRYLTDIGFKSRKQGVKSRDMLDHAAAVALFESAEGVIIPKLSNCP